MMTKYEFLLPQSFRAADHLPLRLATRADDANWLVSTIVRKTAHKDIDPGRGCVRLHTDVMRRVMGQNTIAEPRTDCVDRLVCDAVSSIDDDINRELAAVS